MSEFITSKNIDNVVKKNYEIKDEILDKVMFVKTNPEIMKISSMSQLGLLILQKFGLIQMPVDDKFWSGAIYVKKGKMIPVINTALPRVNQYFTSWHEIYHLIFDKVSFDHFIESENTLEERKAECFAANMLLDGVDRFYDELSEMEFVEKVYHCMLVFQAPYKAVLISLYEYADSNANERLKENIKEVFDFPVENIEESFETLGLDSSLVRPSYVINTGFLQEKISRSRKMNPELRYHNDNAEFLENIKKEIKMITGKDE